MLMNSLVIDTPESTQEEIDLMVLDDDALCLDFDGDHIGELIKFTKRDVGCWRNKEGVVDEPVMEFESIPLLFDYINEQLPWTTNGDYELRLSDPRSDGRQAVLYWTVLGWVY